MATGDHIRNPIEWGLDKLSAGTHSLEQAGYNLSHHEEAGTDIPEVRRVTVDDLWYVLARGVSDLGAYRTDVMFVCIIYPVAGLVLALLASGYGMLPLVFPLISGFALVGPVAAIGLYEISRRREEGKEASWSHAFGVIHAPAFSTLVALSLVLFAIFAVWLAVAYAIFLVTLGPEPPASIGAFASDVFTTGAGWAMIALGVGVGFLFAVLVLAISVVSFPMVLDRNVGLKTAITTSVRVVAANPRTMAVWGAMIAGGLVLGSLPALLGLILLLPVLGHATWHLYRKAIAH